MTENQYWAVMNFIAGIVLIVGFTQIRGCYESECRSKERVEAHCIRARGEWLEGHCRFVGGVR